MEWYGWEMGSGEPSQYFEQPEAFAKSLSAGESPEIQPPLKQKIKQMTRMKFNQSHRDLASHLPALIFENQVIQPFRLANLVLVLRVVEHKPAEVIAYNTLIDQVPQDYLRVHGKVLGQAWLEKAQQAKNFQLNTNTLKQFKKN